MTPEQDIQWLREAQFKMMDQLDILWRITRRGLDDDEHDKLDELFRYHCGYEAHHVKEWIAGLPGLEEGDDILIMRERMMPRNPTPREELLERLVQAMTTGTIAQVTTLKRVLGL